MSFNMHQHHMMICGVVNDPGTGGQSQRNKWSTCAVQMVNLARNIQLRESLQIVAGYAIDCQ
jgi:hypothetical protein